MQSKTICYLGDGTVQGAAAYLAGIMTHFGIAYDRVDSDAAPPAEFAETHYAAYVLSDYPAERLTEAHFEHILNDVRSGAGLVMFGGWESYHGRLGEYHRSPLAAALPVLMQDTDDRRNFAQPVLAVPCPNAASHPILAGLPWETPPGIGGFNLFDAKPDAEALMRAVRFHALFQEGGFLFDVLDSTPLLVVGTFGEGRTVALATDVAPHWVGGFVDWGRDRVVQDVPGGDFVDIGADYAAFFRNILLYATGE